MSSTEDENSTDESKDTVAPLCTCCQFRNDDASKLSSEQNNNSTWLESSFVQLLAPRKNEGGGGIHSHTTANFPQQQQHGFLESHELILQLSAAAAGNSSNVPALCPECIERVSTALEEDTQRLYKEADAYTIALTDSKQRAKSFQNMNMNMAQKEEQYAAEIDMLQQEVLAREAELSHLSSLLQDQLAISKQLQDLDSHLQEETIGLELQARAFDHSVDLQTTTLSQIQGEVDRLSLVKLPHSLFDLQVDQRGLRYPLINQLRLAFRPKGDVPMKEIEVAWAQATQLLLMLGTLLEYPSSDWKLVPLSDSAKLIYKKEIYNMTPGDCRSLIAWNALLDQVVRHATTIATSFNNTEETSSSRQQQQQQRPPPFPSSTNSIGSTDLTHLDRMDHVAWSHVIHRMASNLLWLSDTTAELVAKQVNSLAHAIE